MVVILKFISQRMYRTNFTECPLWNRADNYFCRIISTSTYVI